MEGPDRAVLCYQGANVNYRERTVTETDPSQKKEKKNKQKNNVDAALGIPWVRVTISSVTAELTHRILLKKPTGRR